MWNLCVFLYNFCMQLLCIPFVYTFCVQLFCTAFVYNFCLVLCFLYNFCVAFVCNFCVQLFCTTFLYNFSVQLFCTTFLYNFSVKLSCTIFFESGVRAELTTTITTDIFLTPLHQFFYFGLARRLPHVGVRVGVFGQQCLAAQRVTISSLHSTWNIVSPLHWGQGSAHAGLLGRLYDEGTAEQRMEPW